jgi:hypothetical protein
MEQWGGILPATVKATKQGQRRQERRWQRPAAASSHEMMRFIEAIDMAHRFGARSPDFHEDDPHTVLWIKRIAELPLAQQCGRLAEAIAEANHYASLSGDYFQ